MKPSRLAIAILAASLCLGRLAAAAEPDFEAVVIDIEGQALYENQEQELAPLELGAVLGEGDRVVTREGAALQISLPDGSNLRLGPNSELAIHELSGADAARRSIFQLLKGALHAMVEKLAPGSTFEVQGPNSVAAVKGTEFELASDGLEDSLSVNEGVVGLSDPDRLKTEEVKPLQRAFARKGRLEPAQRLAKRELGEWRSLLARGQEVRGQREARIASLKEKIKAWRELSRKRRSALKAKSRDARSRRKIEEKRQRARDRFREARQRLDKDEKP